jgi:hypothetical protein
MPRVIAAGMGEIGGFLFDFQDRGVLFSLTGLR